MSAISVMATSSSVEAERTSLGELVERYQRLEQRRQRLQRQHGRRLGGARIVGVLMCFDEDCSNANRHRGTRKDRRKLSLAAGTIAKSPWLRDGVGRIEDDRVAGLCHDRQGAHVD